ncbi:MAG: CRISPR-associated endonuclease Cas1 [Acidobacteria bacterium]|nr:CRISPR-associated endonuclease Cas1 [Acidobacteriota bacterium]
MGMVYVKEQGAVIRKRGARVVVEKDETQLGEIRLRETEAIAVFGGVQVTTQALSEALERGVPVAFFTRHGRLKGHLVPVESKNVELRLAQYRAATDAGRRLELARGMVEAKMLNSAAVIAAYRSNYPDSELAEAEERLRRAAEGVGDCGTLDELMGREGAASAAYFGVFGRMNRSGLPFEGRRKHPATDPLNALLSLGYTMVMNELWGLAEGAGLEPHIGFLHGVEYGRPSLALDLVEPYRAAVADALALGLVNLGVLREADFAWRLEQGGQRPVVLAPAALERYLRAYEERMSEPRAAAPKGLRAELEADVAKLARALRTGEEFRPYREA